MQNLSATELLYPIYVLFTLTLTLIFIPRDHYKEYLIYGLLVGGLGDIVVVMLMQNLFGVMQFKNQGIFYVLGHHALSPLAWTLTVMLFLFFLPNRKWFRYLYVIYWAMMSVGYGYLVHNAELFEFKSWLYPIPAFFIFIAWWSVATWLFRRTSNLAKRNL
ncbi:MAG: hypothetical protein GX020_00145 [Firmicutes bacterium]|nr:hypothetical protein [Bacillota bacterium]